jgi:hypothetical protein
VLPPQPLGCVHPEQNPGRCGSTIKKTVLHDEVDAPGSTREITAREAARLVSARPRSRCIIPEWVPLP